MRWRGAQTRIGAALAALALGGGGWLVAAGTTSDGDAYSGPSGHAARSHSAAHTGSVAGPAATVYATVGGSAAGSPLPPGFLGMSLEYTALEAYTGGPAPDPVFVQLLRNLGQPLVLRIGGNSTDATWWPVPGMRRPAGVSYTLTPRWLSSARALAETVHAKLILGINLAATRPRLAAAEAGALLGGVGAQNVAALELGNEPDVYAVFPRYFKRHRPVFARPAGYGLNAFIRQAARFSAALPSVPLAGPATAKLPWLAGVPALLRAEPRLRLVTVHRYAVQGCSNDPASPGYPSIPNLLSDRSSAGLAAALRPDVALAHARGLPFRVDELNSAALAGCLGRPGVSNTFASSLWVLDTLFDLAAIGVDGVNIHSLPGAAYEPFTFTRTPGGQWQAFVRPDYYGMLMFAQAFPPGARLVQVQAPGGPVKVWATRGPDAHTRVALINKDSRPHRVELQLPAPGPASLERLEAPAAAATAGVTLGGQTFGAETATGALAPPQLERVPSLLGSYSIQLPPMSAALLTQ